MFPCTKCGLCCQNLRFVGEMREFMLPNGVCKHYDVVSRECKIYDTRPELCRVDDMYIYYKDRYTKKEFYEENAKVCNKLQEDANMDISYRVKIGE